MSTHNICFNGEIKKLVWISPFVYSAILPVTMLSCSLMFAREKCLCVSCENQHARYKGFTSNSCLQYRKKHTQLIRENSIVIGPVMQKMSA